MRHLRLSEVKGFVQSHMAAKHWDLLALEPRQSGAMLTLKENGPNG